MLVGGCGGYRMVEEDDRLEFFTAVEADIFYYCSSLCIFMLFFMLIIDYGEFGIVFYSFVIFFISLLLNSHAEILL